MARTTVAEVEAIIEVDETILDIAPFITVANELVTECCGEAGYTDTRLTLIETWLAAHFYAIRDPRLTSEGAGSVRANYESKVDLGLDLTRYGQQAKLLDTAGGLAQLDVQIRNGGRPTVGVSWLGMTRAEREEADLE